MIGCVSHGITSDFLKSYFPENRYRLKVKFSKSKKEIVLSTQESVNEKADIIVACGGNGVINKVASCLIDTDILLGIIPLCSGNGFASSLNIPTDIEKAVMRIKQQKSTKVDVGKINDLFFFNNTGIGFDTSIIRNQETIRGRTFFDYIIASFKSFYKWRKKEEVEVYINKSRLEINPFLIFISNSNKLGYRLSLTPKALLNDGLLDVVIMPQVGKIKILWFGILFLLKKQHLFKGIENFQTRELKIFKKKSHFFEPQVDGELHIIESDSIVITIKEKSLNVIV